MNASQSKTSIAPSDGINTYDPTEPQDEKPRLQCLLGDLLEVVHGTLGDLIALSLDGFFQGFFGFGQTEGPQVASVDEFREAAVTGKTLCLFRTRIFYDIGHPRRPWDEIFGHLAIQPSLQMQKNVKWNPRGSVYSVYGVPTELNMVIVRDACARVYRSVLEMDDMALIGTDRVTLLKSETETEPDLLDPFWPDPSRGVLTFLIETYRATKPWTLCHHLACDHMMYYAGIVDHRRFITRFSRTEEDPLWERTYRYIQEASVRYGFALTVHPHGFLVFSLREWLEKEYGSCDRIMIGLDGIYRLLDAIRPHVPPLMTMSGWLKQQWK